MSKNNVNWDDVIVKTKRLSDFSNAKTKHILEKFKDHTKNFVQSTNLSFKEAREIFKKEGLSALKFNIPVTQSSQTIKKLMDNTTVGKKALLLSQHKWFRKGAMGIGIAVSLMAIQKGIDSFKSQPVLPKNQKHSYDVLTQTMTDFGSPVKLLKTASKTITPYVSSVRKGIVTTTSNVTEQNMALFLNKNAIGHTRY